MKLKIDNEAMVDDFFENTRLLGIMAPLKDYSFTWHVNQIMGFSFRINHNIEIQLRKKKRDYFFSIFEYNIPGSCMFHYVYNNKYDGEYLLPEFKHLDFLWLVKDEEMADDELSVLQQSLKKIPGIQLVNEMTHEKIKNKQHLIF